MSSKDATPQQPQNQTSNAMQTTFNRAIELHIDGQRFRHIGTTSLPDQRGRYAVLTARCSFCGESFVQHALGNALLTGSIVRRCPAHRDAGRQVNEIHPSALGEPPTMDIGPTMRAPTGRRSACNRRRQSLRW